MKRLQIDKLFISYAIFALLLILGYAFGCIYGSECENYTLIQTLEMPNIAQNRLISVYSDFLFGHILAFGLIFVFGFTILGCFLTPAALFFNGFLMGMRMSYIRSTVSLSGYLREWVLFWPSVLSFVLLVLVAVRAFKLSLFSCSFIHFTGGKTPSVKRFTYFFLISLFLTVVFGLIHCMIYLFLAVFL